MAQAVLLPCKALAEPCRRDLRALMHANRPEACLHGVSHSLRLSEIGTKRRCRVLALLASTVIKPRSRSISLQSSRCNSAIRRPANAPRARKGRRVSSALVSKLGDVLRREDRNSGFRLLVPHHRRERASAFDQIAPAFRPIAAGHQNNPHSVLGFRRQRAVRRARHPVPPSSGRAALGREMPWPNPRRSCGTG